MKKLSLFIVSFLPIFIFSQFATDVTVRQSSVGSFRDPDAACASNGNLFVAYLTDSAGLKGCEIQMSTNYGISWQRTHIYNAPGQEVKDVAIANSGYGSSEKLYMLIAATDIGSNESLLRMNVYNATTGLYETSEFLETNLASVPYAIDMDSDANYPQPGVTNVGMIVAFDGIIDSLRYYYWNGVSMTSKIVNAVVDETVEHTNISYAVNANFSGVFFMSWSEVEFQAFPIPGFWYERVYFATTGATPFASSGISTIRVDDIAPTHTEKCTKPFVITQNNGSMAPSGTASYGLLHGVIYLKDSTDATSNNIMGYVNKNYVSFVAPPTNYQPEAGSFVVKDYASTHIDRYHHIIWHQKNTNYLRWISHDDFINNPTNAFVNELVPFDHINDNPVNTINPDPAVTMHRLAGSPAFFWVDDITGRGVIKYDAPYMSAFASISNEIKQPNISIYPNPLFGGELNIEFNLKNSTDVLVQLINSSGQIVYSTIYTPLIIGPQKININRVHSLSKGVYYLKLSNNQQLNITETFIVH